MLRFVCIFFSYAALVYCRRLFFLYPEETVEKFAYTKNEYGFIVTLFSICYTISKLFLGSLNDFISPSVVLAFSVGIVGVVLIFLSCASTIFELYLLVPLTALFQGGAWVAIVKLLKQNYSSTQFSILFTIMSCTNNFSGIFAPILMGESWVSISFIFGLFMIGYSLLIYCLVINKDQTGNDTGKRVANEDYKKIIKSLTIWKISIFLLITLSVRALFEMWSPVYFAQNPEISNNFRQSASIFEIGGAVGSVVAGLLVQYLENYFDRDEVRWHTGAMFTGIMLIAANSFFSGFDVYFLNSFISGFAVYACINVYGIITADASPYYLCGMTSAMVSFLSNFGPIIVGSPLAYFIDTFGFISIPMLLQFTTVLFVSLIFVTKNIPLHLLVEKQD
uniref:MFS transporter n=1 Tax=Panagrolaimus sp. JU765 TaxID=591449 RepID=A0AC34QBN2_9BILA